MPKDCQAPVCHAFHTCNLSFAPAIWYNKTTKSVCLLCTEGYAQNSEMRMSNTLRYPHYVSGIALVLGICADWLFYGRWPGISIPIFVGLLLAGLAGISLIEKRLPTHANLWIAAAAFWFALCLALRAAPLLLFLNMVACLGLLLLLVATYRGTALLRLPLHHYLLHPLVALFEMTWRPAPLTVQSVANLPLRGEGMHRLIPVGRGLVVATPIVFCFTLLLMAADSVFASYVEQIIVFPFNISSLLAHAFIIGMFAWISAGGLLVALTSAERARSVGVLQTELPAEGKTRRLDKAEANALPGCVEAITVLTLVNVLFGSFLLIQATYLFGGLDTLERTGMTYADYARRGFFELLAVACLSLALLWGLAVLTRRVQLWQRLGFYASNALLVVLVLGLLASAFQRMLLYEEAYGFTRLRVYTHSFMLWLALVFLLFLVALLREQLRLFVAGGFVSALVYLSLLNLVNPDAMIVHNNIARYQQHGTIDIYYLTQLSNDAIPALAATLDTLGQIEQEQVQQHLELQRIRLTRITEQNGWPGQHLARIRALAAINQSIGEQMQE